MIIDIDMIEYYTFLYIIWGIVVMNGAYVHVCLDVCVCYVTKEFTSEMHAGSHVRSVCVWAHSYHDYVMMTQM
jgi:hypothetical protein